MFGYFGCCGRCAVVSAPVTDWNILRRIFSASHYIVASVCVYVKSAMMMSVSGKKWPSTLMRPPTSTKTFFFFYILSVHDLHKFFFCDRSISINIINSLFSYMFVGNVNYIGKIDNDCGFVSVEIFLKCRFYGFMVSFLVFRVYDECT